MFYGPSLVAGQWVELDCGYSKGIPGRSEHLNVSISEEDQVIFIVLVMWQVCDPAADGEVHPPGWRQTGGQGGPTLRLGQRVWGQDPVILH